MVDDLALLERSAELGFRNSAVRVFSEQLAVCLALASAAEFAAALEAGGKYATGLVHRVIRSVILGHTQ